jgi:hypothetical protein
VADTISQQNSFRSVRRLWVDVAYVRLWVDVACAAANAAAGERVCLCTANISSSFFPVCCKVPKK